MAHHRRRAEGGRIVGERGGDDVQSLEGGEKRTLAHMGVRQRHELGEAVDDSAAEDHALRVERVHQTHQRGAEQLVRETGELLGAALVSLVNAFNPKRVILGGGIIDGFPELVSLAHAHVRERALLAALQGLDIIPAALANDAPAIGAAAMARHLLDSSTPGAAT